MIAIGYNEQKAYFSDDLLTGLLVPYWEILSPIFFARPELARAVRKSEGFVFLVRTDRVTRLVKRLLSGITIFEGPTSGPT